jgi:hypothetical protein
MAGSVPPFLGSGMTVAQKEELLMNRRKIRIIGRGIKLFLIFISFRFGK